jgi:hypothetical protein
LPVTSEPRAKDRKKTENSGEEDGSPTPEIKVQGIGYPTATRNSELRGSSNKNLENLQEGGGNVRCSIDQTDKPVVTVMVWRSFRRIDTKRRGEG